MIWLFYLYVYGTVCIVIVNEFLRKRYRQPEPPWLGWPHFAFRCAAIMLWPVWILPVLVKATRS